MTSISFVKTINEFKVSLLKKEQLFHCNRTRISSKIIAFLYSHNLIHKYNRCAEKYKIWFKMLRNINLIKELQLISRPGWKKYFSFYKIKTLCWQNINNLYIISAPTALPIKNNLPGFISQNQAIDLRTGGEILVKIVLI